jgi:lipoprotein-anchoring transpeptidase ErfK/SrfK
MANKTFIAVAALVFFLLAGSVAVYAYDSSNDDRVANGIRIAGVPVGGLDADQARKKLRAKLQVPLEKPIVVEHGKKRFTLSAEDAAVKADVGGMVDDAVAASRGGNILGRTLRDLTGGEEPAQIDPRVGYSKVAVAKLVARVQKGVDRPARDATVNFPSLNEVKEQDGVKTDRAGLERNVRAALTSPDDRTADVPVSVTKAKVTREELASKYPKLIVVDRASFTLRFYEKLKLAKSYRIAVGQVGLETPAGLYHIQNKGVNVPWSVPNSPWAGSLAGTVIPGGVPENPLKARWMGIFAGAGIHGTDQIGSLGSAASHGCVRMAIPDVIELYDKVPVGAPVYVA